MIPAASGMVALPKLGMIASKAENVARQAAGATVDIQFLVGSSLREHRRSVTTALAWLNPNGTARVAAVIFNPGLAIIFFSGSK